MFWITLSCKIDIDKEEDRSNEHLSAVGTGTVAARLVAWHSTLASKEGLDQDRLLGASCFIAKLSKCQAELSGFWHFLSTGVPEGFLQADEHSPGNCPSLQSQLTLLSTITQRKSGTQSRSPCYTPICTLWCEYTLSLTVCIDWNLLGTLYLERLGNSVLYSVLSEVCARRVKSSHAKK